MFTIIEFVKQTPGAIFVVGGIVGSIILFNTLFLFFRANRSFVSWLLHVGLLLLILEICDMFWLSGFFPNGAYVSPGTTAGLLNFLVFPTACFLITIAGSILNKLLREQKAELKPTRQNAG